MFYGEVGCVLEIIREAEGNRYCFYNSESRIIDTGRYKNDLFEGVGFREEEKLCAIELSRAIPSPFIRIDMISNENSWFVGEITAHPGGFDEFNKEWDFYLGKKFMNARARLFEDLLLGKRFDTYLNRYEQSHIDALRKF